MKNQDFFRMNTKKPLATLKVIQFASFALLSVTSTFILNQTCAEFWNKHFDSPLIIVPSTVLCVIFLLLCIDYGLKTFLPFVFVEILGKDFKKPERKRMRLLTYLLAGFSFFQIVATTSLTYYSADEIANVSQTKPTSETLTITTERQAKKFDKSLESYDAEIAHLRSTESSRVAAAKADAELLTQAAIQSKGTKMARLYRSKKDKWAKLQLENAVTAAHMEGRKLINKEKALLPAAISARRNFVEKTNSTDASITTLLETELNEDFAEYKTLKAERKTLLRYGAGVFVFLLIVSTFCISLIEVDTLENPHHSDEEHTSLRDSLSRFWKRIREHYAKRIDNRLQTATPVTAYVTATPATTSKPLSVHIPNPVTPAPVTPPKPVTVAPAAVPVTSKNVTIQMRDNHPIFLHESGGTTKPMTLGQVSSNVRKYRQRVKETAAKLATDPNNPAKKQTLENRQNMLAFWTAVREKMNNYS